MKHLFLLSALALGIAGCNQPADEPPAAPAPEQTQAAGSGAGDITPMTPTPMPNAPVAGGENLQGGGSAVGQIAKDRARSLGGGSSLDQMSPDGP